MNAADPVRVLFIAKRVIIEKPMTSVFVIPRRVRNSLLLFFVIRLPISPACPDPMPGRNEQRGAAKREARIGFFIFILGLVILCSGIWILFFMDCIKMDAPNNPVSNGSSG